MKKKIMALVVAVVLLVAMCPVSAMADGFGITQYTGLVNLVVGEKGEANFFICNDFIPTGAELRYEGYDDAIVEVKTSSFNSSSESFIVLFNPKAVGSTQVTVSVYQGQDCLDSVEVYVSVIAPNEYIGTITVEMDNPVYGQKVLGTSCKLSSDLADSVKVKTYSWQKFPTGTDPDLAETITDPEEVFQKGYEYFYTLRIEVQEGYTVFEDTKCTFNGEEDTIEMQGNYFVLENTFTPVEAKEETTTAATTVKAGDTLSITFYVVALIVLAAGAGVTLFATKRR